ncbi:MAG: hypothetical protein K8U57_39670 [Planctomycetes bacterium]|nr:hypothetical protein [Planctomycetota bacterium]
MAKAKSPDEIIVDALTKAFNALPTAIPLSGSKSLFTAAQGNLAEQAVQDGYLTKSVRSVPGGKGKSKQIEFGVLTKAGILKVVEKDSPKAALEALLPAIEKIGKPATQPSPSEFKASLETATATCVAAIQTAFASLQRDVLHHITPADGSADPAPVLAALRFALEKVEPVVVELPAPPLPATTNPPTGLSVKTLVAEVVDFVKATAQERSVGCDFEELFNHLQKRHPDLSIGTFHDTLRNLEETNQIRLGGWARALDDMTRPELALFISYKVMYYAHPAQ